MDQEEALQAITHKRPSEDLDNAERLLGQLYMAAATSPNLNAKPKQTAKQVMAGAGPKSTGVGMAGETAAQIRAEYRSICSWLTNDGRQLSGMVTAVGKHGVTVRDGKGRQHKVYHSQIKEAKTPVKEHEHNYAIAALTKQGSPIAIDQRISRYVHGKETERRPTAKQLERLKYLISHGAPINYSMVQKEATAEEAQALIDKFAKIARPKLVLRKAVR